MATTTNYGWTTPDDTGLVKDGASAIRSLGTSVDTTIKNLNPSTTLGDIEYRSSTANTNTRLGIGSTGQVLTVSGGVPVWSAVPSTSALMFLAQSTPSAASSVSFDSIFTSSYANYLIIGTLDGSTDNDTNIRFRASGTDDTSSNYTYSVLFNGVNTLSSSGGGASDSTGKFANSGTSGTSSFSAMIFSPQLSKSTIWQSNQYRFASSSGARCDFYGNFTPTTSFDGIKIYPSSGTITGNIRVYGVANS